jgi:archaellum component FlaF (FlaF/FlaG flagellin family)
MTLLIAIAVAAAFLVGEWLGPFTDEQTTRAEEESAEFHTCKNTYVRVLDIAASSQSANVTIMNAGMTNLSTVDIVALADAQVVARASVTNLLSSEHAATQLDTGGTRPERIVVIPKDCPQMTVQRQP